MEKLKIQTDRIWKLLVEKRVVKLITLLMGTYLLAETCRNLCYGAESEFQIFRDYYFYRASAFILVTIICMRRITFKSIILWAYVAGYVGYVLRYLYVHQNDYGPDYELFLKSKFVAEGLFILIILDVIISKKVTRLDKKKLGYIVITLAAVVITHILNYEFSKCVLFPAVALFLTPISKKQWKVFTDCLAFGFYAAFVWIMGKSLYYVPYTGGRYYGAFLNLYTSGAFAAGALMCSIYFAIKLSRNWRKTKWGLILSVLSMGFPLYSLAIIGARSAQVGVFLSLMLVFVFVWKQPERATMKRRGIAVVFATVLLLAAGSGLLAFMNRWDSKTVAEGIANPFIASKLHYWVGRANTFMDTDSKYGVIPEGTIWNAIDRFSSDRLSIAIESIRTNTLLGSSYIGVDTDKVSFMYPHNNYLTWLRAYGWVGGIPVIIWFITYLFFCVRRIIDRDDGFLLPFLWVVFCAGLFLTDTMLWGYPVSAILIFLQYPMLVMQEDEAE